MNDKPDPKLIPQSGVIPFRKGKDGYEIFLVTSKKADMWVVPKGHLELDMTPRESAAKESWEEAGARGAVSIQPASVFFYERNNKRYVVEVFLQEVDDVSDDYPEYGERDREWVSVEEACHRLVNDDLRATVSELPQLADRMEREHVEVS